MSRTIKTFVETQPTPGDLHVMAMSVYPKFREFVSAGQDQLEDTFRRAFNLPMLSPPLTPGEFAVFGTAALGILMTDRMDLLASMRPGLAAWLNRNREKFRSEGLLEA